MGKLHRKWILVPKEAKVIYIRQDKKREWISVIESNVIYLSNPRIRQIPRKYEYMVLRS
jgi:hypothetical protein